MTLGERIQEIRLKNRLSQEEFGEMLGTTRQSVSKWERDAAFPELEKIVRMAELFSVTTDYILRDGVDTFVPSGEFRCRVLRSVSDEIVLTERFALHFYENKSKIGCRLYTGSRVTKLCTAAVEYDQVTDATSAAGVYESGESWQCGENAVLQTLIGTDFSAVKLKGMHETESFAVMPSDSVIPKVSEAGIASALKKWRMGAEYTSGGGECSLHLCTPFTEYIFSVRPDFADIYIGASWNQPFELGLFGGQQYFRIRDCEERKVYCSFFCSLTQRRRIEEIPTGLAILGQCVSTPQGLMWCVKRYTDDEIVLQGCGDDEYVFRRDSEMCERYCEV